MYGVVCVCVCGRMGYLRDNIACAEGRFKRRKR